ncbi:arginine 2,3-aminomutase [candidate division WWE3 bacterium CG08_land_8_20_14_0_20_41_10]|uniref:Arginine 2,3-aminomutase n=1 Tax=candidate division WWE3 bacterium CG08_land_8_20_14_0_20_41_10 TaxID=1975085 RepID=A0A2H0XC48_UNCKA|nr:MAG: arginine 2,3-aminomutase [candidate division WWE3 bacterium CG08_land_8_20_14_0_20_41_10]
MSKNAIHDEEKPPSDDSRTSVRDFLPFSPSKENGKLAVLISPHLKSLAKKSKAVHAEFYPSPQEECVSTKSFLDPLMEDQFVKTRGLVHKYPNRVLIELTLSCASYCRFCTRRRMVSDIKKLILTEKDVDNMYKYLQSQPDVNEVVISGGDPFTVPVILKYALQKFNALKSITIIRIHTRVPVSNPHLIKPSFYTTLKQVKKPLYISIHFEHPDEITKATVAVINKLKACGATLLSQSVFLKGVNDDYETLYKLFRRLPELGILPYYIYRCDPVAGAEHFIVPFAKELEITTKLRANLSGIACPTYVIDTPNGSGKIPVPLNFWEFNKTSFHDFLGKKIIVRQN